MKAQRSVCAYPWQQMIIDLTGEVVPCCFWMGYGNTGRPLGNTNVQMLQEIWNGEAYQELRRRNASGDLGGHPCNKCVAYEWGDGVYPKFSWPASFSPETGHCYLALIPESFRDRLGDALARSMLLEGGKPLLYPGALHDDIRNEGYGRYSVWGPHLYFSSSDNSDPSANGRAYTLVNGEHRLDLKNLVADSTSARNLRLAHEEYSNGIVDVRSKPSMISYISTADCNIDCPACSQNVVRVANVQHRPETTPQVLELVPYLAQLIWHGGEPYLIKRFRRFIDEFDRSVNPNLTFGFTSNGTMLTEREVEKLLKFPRLNASISIDSFNAKTFARIRKGADFDRVLTHLRSALAIADAPERFFAVGMIVCKSNFAELSENLQYAMENDIGLNLSPVVVYPVTERLDVFEDFSVQASGWKDILRQATEVARKALARNARAVERVNPLGMLHELELILARAEGRYSRTLDLNVTLKDPFRAVARMVRPGIVAFNENIDTPLAYFRVHTGSPNYRLRIPYEDAMRQGRMYIRFYADMFDEPGRLCETLLRQTDRASESILDIANVEVRIPNVFPFIRDRNITYANYGESTPEGLNVRRSEEIWDRFGQISREGTKITRGEWRSQVVARTVPEPAQRRPMRRFLEKLSDRVSRFF